MVRGARLRPDLAITNANGTTGCARETNQDGAQKRRTYTSTDYPSRTTSPSSSTRVHRQSRSPACPSQRHDHRQHAGGRRLSTKDPANHQYDSHDFFDALRGGTFPAVSYLKAPGYQDGHPGYFRDPIDEQAFIVQVITAVQESGDWDTTAIVITYDDSDGWYDHQAPSIVRERLGAARPQTR